MLIRSYTGRSMQEALEKVRQQLGEQALIIETRSIKEPGLLGKKTGYEVIAAIDSAEQRDPPAPRTSHQLQALRERPAHIQGEWRPIHNPKLDSYVATMDKHLEESTQQNTIPSAAPSALSNQAAALSAAAEQAKALNHNDHDLISHELCSIRRQLARLATGHEIPTAHLGEELSQHLKELELPDEIIGELDDVIEQAGDRLPAEKREDFIKRFLNKTLDCSHQLQWEDCKNIIIVGPTGVGKTTTLAKIAGDMVLNHKRRIALVTIDTYRVGAAEQLQAYADLLDVPFEVAQTPAQLQRILERFEDYDHVLIDTAGRSPADSTKVQELKAFCRAAKNCAVMLAISATSGRTEFAAVIERFSILPIELCVLTKMDELESPGRLFGCIRRHRLPVHLITDGQEVPEDLRIAQNQDFVNPLFATHTTKTMHA